MKIALILFAYNRPKYLKRAIKTHVVPAGIDTFAFIDYSETQKKIYKIIDEANIYKTIFKRPENLGLNESIKRGIQHIFNLGYDAVIVLEDDLLLSGDALFYLKFQLEYLFHPFIYAVSCQEGDGLNKRFRCWAWGTWKDKWEKIDWGLKPEEKNRDSWDVIVNENFRVNGWRCYCSEKPRVKHIGWSGIHYKQLDRFSIRILLRKLF